MSQLREHLRQAAVTTIWHEASAEQQLKALCLQAADELAAAEARCTALQQQLEAARNNNERVAKLYLAAKDSEADLRGSITRLIAQWRRENQYGDRRRADQLEAALTRQGEASK